MTRADLVGQVLDGKYSIERPLGKGGMGTVYLATHIGTGRPVAVKVIAPDFMERAEFVERFRREAQAAGRLRHPNVVDVTDFGFSAITDGNEVAYLVMEYLDGCTLGEILDEERQLPVAWSIDIIEQVCSAVEEAHRQGIIHRDLKPDNIWLEPNQRGGYTVKVLDFGIAKLEEAQLKEAEHSGRFRIEGPRGTLVEEGKETVFDSGDGDTIVEGGGLTSVRERETLSLGGDPDDRGQSASGLSTEGGTVIMKSPGESDPEISDKNTFVIGDGQSTDRADRSTPSTANLTRLGAVLGTPLYMSPEQCRGERLTPRSDIYSLAVIMYQMFSGKTPFEGDYIEVMEGHKNEVPPPLDRKKVSKKLRKTVMNALAKAPDDRPESAEAFANKLRANSEGLGSLLTRGFVVYAERLPKFVLLAFITFIPLIIVTFLRIGINFLIASDYFEEGVALRITSSAISIFSFFLQIVSAALLVGMTTWVVGQILAYPLRPINLWAAFKEAKSKIRTLAFTVVVSNLIAMVGLVLLFIPGVWISARFMLIAPSVMMEGVKGRSAFKRSFELTGRSFRTVFGAALLVFVVPGLIALLMGLSISSIVGNFEKSAEIAKLKKEGVAPAVKVEKTPDAGRQKRSNVNISLGKRNVIIGNDDTSASKRFRTSIMEGLFELIYTPIALLLTSFTAVLSALIYFKTRQAGGESMQELLGKLNSSNCPQTKWQERVNRRLIQSGRVSSRSGTT